MVCVRIQPPPSPPHTRAHFEQPLFLNDVIVDHLIAPRLKTVSITCSTLLLNILMGSRPGDSGVARTE